MRSPARAKPSLGEWPAAIRTRGCEPHFQRSAQQPQSGSYVPDVARGGERGGRSRRAVPQAPDQALRPPPLNRPGSSWGRAPWAPSPGAHEGSRRPSSPPRLLCSPGRRLGAGRWRTGSPTHGQPAQCGCADPSASAPSACSPTRARLPRHPPRPFSTNRHLSRHFSTTRQLADRAQNIPPHGPQLPQVTRRSTGRLHPPHLHRRPTPLPTRPRSRRRASDPGHINSCPGH